MPPRPRPERKCHICGKTFGKTEHLERHIRSHTHDKPFTCNVCNKSFSRNDTLLRHWRSHGVDGPAPASSAAQARRPQAQVAQHAQNNVPGTQPPQGQHVQQQPLPEFNPYNGYPPLPMQGYSQNVGGQVGQNIPDRHTEAASVLMTLPQSHPSFASNPQDGSAEVHHDFTDSGLPFPPTGQDTSSHMLPDYTDDALDPMLSLTAAQGQATMDANAESQLAHQYPAGQQGQMVNTPFRPPTNLLVDYALFDARFAEKKLPGEFDTSKVNPLLNGVGIKISSPVTNGDHVKEEGVAAGAGAGAGDNKVENSSLLWYSNPENKVPVFSGSPDQIQKLVEQPASLDSLSLSFKMYFARFMPTFPTVHAPTFLPAQETPLLFRAICSIGSLYTGSRVSATQSILAFEELKTAVEEEWKKCELAEDKVKFAVIQAGLNTNLSGLLSGYGKNLNALRSEPNLLGAWAANLGVFDNEDPFKVLARENPPNGDELDQIWRKWARNEERLRVLHGLRILDAELANLFSRQPAVMNDVNNLPQIAPDDLFQAWSAPEWLSLIQTKYPVYLEPPSHSFDHSLHQYAMRGQLTSRFAAFAILEVISSVIQEARLEGTLDAKTPDLSSQLMDFYNRFCSTGQMQDPEQFSLTILWHTTFISLLVDYHMLEIALGRDGPEAATSVKDIAKLWAASSIAQRCLTHAVLVEHHVNNLRVGREIAIHVPRGLYIAAITTYGYNQFAPPGAHEITDGLSFPEMELVAASISMAAPRPNFGGRDITHRLADLLLHIGHFEISRKFALTLESLFVA